MTFDEELKEIRSKLDLERSEDRYVDRIIDAALGYHPLELARLFYETRHYYEYEHDFKDYLQGKIFDIRDGKEVDLEDVAGDIQAHSYYLHNRTREEKAEYYRVKELINDDDLDNMTDIQRYAVEGICGKTGMTPSTLYYHTFGMEDNRFPNWYYADATRVIKKGLTVLNALNGRYDNE